MKEMIVTAAFILFSLIIIVVLWVNDTYGINLMQGISWPRFTSTNRKLTNKKTSSSPKSENNTDTKSSESKRSIKIRKANTRLPPPIELPRPKTYKGGRKRSDFETMVKQALEMMFPDVGFRTIRPSFNMGLKKRALEYDLYSHCYRLSIEAHGIQHYEYTPFFHKSIQEFYDQQERDQITRDNAAKAELTHIEVPYWCTDIDQVIEHIEYEFEKLGGYEPVFYCQEGCNHDIRHRECNVIEADD